MPDYTEAVQLAKVTKRPIMLIFSGSDWCPWCKKLTNEVFKTHEFAAWSTRNVVKYEVDFPHSAYQQSTKTQQTNHALKQKYGTWVQVFPTVLFIQPDGTVIGKMQYDGKGVAGFVSQAAAVLPPRTSKQDLIAAAQP